MKFSGRFVVVIHDNYRASKGQPADYVKCVDPDSGQMFQFAADGVARKFGDPVEINGKMVYGDRNLLIVEKV